MTIKKALDCSSNQAKAYIPVLWKKWFALLHGISVGEITTEDEDVDETEYGTCCLKDVIKNLKFEASHSVTGLPLALYQLENPSMVLLELDKTAKKIHKEYKSALSELRRFSISTQKEFEEIDKECLAICQLKKLYDSKVSVNIQDGYYYTNEEGEQDWYRAEHFDTDRIKAVYEMVSGYCISPIQFDSFLYLINCEDLAIKYEGITDRIVQIKGREMSFYVFLIVLMLGRNPYPDEIGCISNGINDEFQIKTWWARHFTNYVKWNSLPEDNTWVKEYTHSDSFDYVDRAPQKPEGISDEDRIQLKGFLKRETFENIISFDELVTHGFEVYPYNEIDTLSLIACITDDRSAMLNNLYRLLILETRYLLQTRERNSDFFVSNDVAKDILDNNGLSYIVLREQESRLDRIFCGEEIKDYTLMVIDCLDGYKDFVNLANKPMVTNSMIKTIIDSCISNNRKTIRLVREAIDNENYLGSHTNNGGSIASISGAVPTATKIERSAKTIEDCILEMQSQSYIDANGVISMAKAKFARLLVEKGYVKTSKPWKLVFKGPHWERYASCRQIEEDVIKELTKELIWKPYDGKFRVNESGDTLSAANLAKSFTDGDSEYRKRNKIFLEWYHRCKS